MSELCYSVSIFILCVFVVRADEHLGTIRDLNSEIQAMKNTMQVLSDQWEKWHTLFVTSLEPRITSTASIISSIDSNIHNLQERAHVWDTFQLHVTAWNDQLDSMDRKFDILNKAIQQVPILDTKLNTILANDEKLNKLIKLADAGIESLMNLDNNMKSKQFCKTSGDSLFEEFAARGILSSLKMVERKMDQILSKRPVDIFRVNEKITPISFENVINDISAKVDIIFDSISKTNENDYDEYIDSRDVYGSRDGNFQQKSRLKTDKSFFKGFERNILSLKNEIDQQSAIIDTKLSKNDFVSILEQFSKTMNDVQKTNINLILTNNFKQERTYWLSMIRELKHNCSRITPSKNGGHSEERDGQSEAAENSNTITESPKPTTKSSCDELEPFMSSGVYTFKSSPGSFLKERFFNKQFCQLARNRFWTIIQRRDNFSIQQDFNVSWNDYSLGFGDLQKDFWIGNNYLARLSNMKNLKLRIELEDFAGNRAWAEYEKFQIAEENQNFRLMVGGYSGNASDAFSSHSGSLFSTFDRKNDEAPDCCPCSVSYGGGWWFNRCFESNLNGFYYKKPYTNDYFRGIIWEHWLGNYSLKKSVMMVRSLESRNRSAQIVDP